MSNALEKSIIIHLTYLFTSSSLPTVSVRETKADVVLENSLENLIVYCLWSLLLYWLQKPGLKPSLELGFKPKLISPLV